MKKLPFVFPILLYRIWTNIDFFIKLEFDDNDSYASMLGKIAEFNVAKEYQKLLAPTDRRELVDYPFYVPIASYERPINVISK